MKEDRGQENQSQVVSMLREELTDHVERIIRLTRGGDHSEARLDSIREEARHLETLLREHITEERIKIIDVVQPLWVPDSTEDSHDIAPIHLKPPDPLAGSIVVVDDEQEFSAPLVQQLRRDGYECVEFADPRQALNYLGEHPSQMVLLDVLMPGMSGRETLELIKASETLRDTPVIMTAQRHELEHIAGSIHEGAEDFLAKPYNPTIVRARVASSIQRKQLRELEQRTFQALVKSQQQLAAELSEAAEYVTSLLPERMKEPVATDWRYIPSSQLGGDSFGHHWIDEDHLAIYLLDVCGHGVGAALLSVSVLNFLRSGALRGTEARNPSSVMERLNSTFPMDRHNDMFFSLWYGVYNTRSQRLDYSSGGHPPALLLSSGMEAKSLSSGGTVIGAVPSIQYKHNTVQIPTGSRLYVFSDGAYEINRPGNEMMTCEEFRDLLIAEPEADPLDGILATVRSQHCGDDFEDDFSLMEFRFGEAKVTGKVTITLENRMEELTRLLRFTEEFSNQHGLSKEDLVDIDVILEEMVTNVFKYGRIGSDNEACTIDLSLSGMFIGIIIADHGIPFDPLLLPEVDTSKTIEDRPIGGLGIHFVKKLTVSQSYEYRDGKNILTLTKELRS